MGWFNCLLLYGITETETEEGLTSDPDVKLASLVVERVLLPKLNRKL